MSRDRITRRDFAATLCKGVMMAAASPALRGMQRADAAPSAPKPWATGYVYDDVYQTHELSAGHPESPERLRAIQAYMTQTGLIDQVTMLDQRVAATEHILSLHTQEHYDSVQACETTGPVALQAVEEILGAVKAVHEGTVRNAFCAIRPPGHHSHNNTADYDGYCQGQGFCFYGNVAIAARYAQSLGYRSILICDWDYHYGNGTAYMFRADPTVMLFSTHNFYAYPGTGDPTYTGEGAGEGYTLNVHLEPGAADFHIMQAWDGPLMSRMEQLKFRPDFVLISAGFDSRIDDLLGVFHITDGGFAAVTQKAMAIADTYCKGRLVSCLEGGYNVDGLGRAVCAHVATLAGLDWQQYIPTRTATSLRVARMTAQPRVTHGMLYLPDRLAGELSDVSVVNVAGRTVRSVPKVEMGRNTIDLWPNEPAPGKYVAMLRLKDGRSVAIPFEER